jgi:hypothetical protein
MDNRRVAVIATALAAVLLVWLWRYDLHPVPGYADSPVAYMLDRWTGTVYIVHPKGVRKLPPYVPS